ncbi:hypothetical protein CS063_10235 [Sporanaerobium hydrogeniformans]|uniref:Uncharacterized protein n=1 Tax=Sporanaerobium hydrogeniformans TaxID=3072179 RepID=A0AC61DBQ8_9FIRM|nr:hypothetical protein [Sporanaerobium hydrogeniformans]PHV70458.1 hypothetical protein CS063_10235 [Sporanaerobium hydrogeniformans]
MRKSKLMIGVLVVSIALLGTGYAYWTDQLTLNSTVETGKLNVIYTAAPTLAKGELQQGKGGVLTCGKEEHEHYGIPFSFTDCYDAWGRIVCGKTEHKHGPECYSSASDQVLENEGYIIINPTGTQTSEKEISFGVANMYPGSFATATFTAENNGTIPAVIDYVEVAEGLTDADKAFLGILDVELTGSYIDKDGVTQKLAKTGKLVNLASVMSEFYGNARLEPGKTITTTMKVTFAGNAASGDDYEKNGSTITVKTNWIQHNALTTAAKAE